MKKEKGDQEWRKKEEKGVISHPSRVFDILTFVQTSLLNLNNNHLS
jgi:hypothetical protein